MIATLSLGGSRTFRIRPRGVKLQMQELMLESGSVLVMEGNTQDLFEHELPLRVGDPHRISLTFRSIVAGHEDLEAKYDPCTQTLGEADACDSSQLQMEPACQRAKKVSSRLRPRKRRNT